MMTIAFGFNLPLAVADVSTDIKGHWAETQITSLVEKGIVSGYTDGTFRPDNTITRAEFMTLSNRAFAYKAQADISYTDVNISDWFYEEVAKAKAAGYISGYEDGTMKPNNQISRQEVAIIVAKIKNLNVAADSATLAKFTDAASIPDWSRGAVSAIVKAGYVAGYPDGTFKPTNPITRAEAVIILFKAMDAKVDKPKYAVIEKAGTYGPSTGSEIVTGDITIKAQDTILQNLVINGDLIIAKEVGNGDVTLNNIKVEGKTYIRGGGKDSIHINGGQYKEIVVEKTASGAVRIVATNVEGLSVTIAENAGGEEIILSGEIKTVTVNADVKIVTESKTDIGELKVARGLKDVNIQLAKDSTVKEMVLESKVTVRGEGRIEKATGSQAKESSYEIQPGIISTPSTGGSGSSGGGGDSDKDEDPDEDFQELENYLNGLLGHVNLFQKMFFEEEKIEIDIDAATVSIVAEEFKNKTSEDLFETSRNLILSDEAYLLALGLQKYQATIMLSDTDSEEGLSLYGFLAKKLADKPISEKDKIVAYLNVPSEDNFNAMKKVVEEEITTYDKLVIEIQKIKDFNEKLNIPKATIKAFTLDSFVITKDNKEIISISAGEQNSVNEIDKDIKEKLGVEPGKRLTVNDFINSMLTLNFKGKSDTYIYTLKIKDKE